MNTENFANDTHNVIIFYCPKNIASMPLAVINRQHKQNNEPYA